MNNSQLLTNSNYKKRKNVEDNKALKKMNSKRMKTDSNGNNITHNGADTTISSLSSSFSLMNASKLSSFSLNAFKYKSLTKSMSRIFGSKLTRARRIMMTPPREGKMDKTRTEEIHDSENQQPNRQSSSSSTRPIISSPRVILTPKRRMGTSMGTPLPAPQSASSSSSSIKMSGMKGMTPMCRNASKLWIESIPADVASRLKESMSAREMKRQEAIHELMAGEFDLCQDLALIETTYQNSLINLGILDTVEAFQIFGNLHLLSSVHYSIITQLNECRDEKGVFGSVGHVLLNWVPQLNIYEFYCSNQRNAKALLEIKVRSDKRMGDFLERCIQSPFSRRLDLWSFLDVPRSRLVKYPLMFNSIRKYTHEISEDFNRIAVAINLMERITCQVDRRMGEADCRILLSKIDYDKNLAANKCISNASTIACSGHLKSYRGTKLYCILFDTCFLVTRPTEMQRFMLYRQPIPVEELVLDNSKNIKVSNSFKNQFNQSFVASNKPTKSMTTSFPFRVSSSQRDISFTLQANDHFGLTMWINSLRRINVTHNQNTINDQFIANSSQMQSQLSQMPVIKNDLNVNLFEKKFNQISDDENGSESLV